MRVTSAEGTPTSPGGVNLPASRLRHIVLGEHLRRLPIVRLSANLPVPISPLSERFATPELAGEACPAAHSGTPRALDELLELQLTTHVCLLIDTCFVRRSPTLHLGAVPGLVNDSASTSLLLRADGHNNSCGRDGRPKGSDPDSGRRRSSSPQGSSSCPARTSHCMSCGHEADRATRPFRAGHEDPSHGDSGSFVRTRRRRWVSGRAGRVGRQR